MFRSTGSYEPDHSKSSDSSADVGFDPQALTSLTGQPIGSNRGESKFRSTGSYEPDQCPGWRFAYFGSFDPQALTSLTREPKRISGLI